ncbi:hypothetical protein L596_025528 [Steinernema carpocapsae]|uniref:Nuclear nucleic acid-binding protein C1D n=1 Tax=Steinernema carpocapsae TaxID=34508 RepID=A0A4U5M801_STECR|nr:hypothetical protein L596_025528 [Steinernema carpocapsae]
MAIPQDVQENIKNFIECLHKVEDTVNKLVAVSDPTDRTAIEEVRMELATLFSLNTLFWANSRLEGKDPTKNEELKLELKRTKEYIGRLKEIDDKENRPKVNQKVAQAMVRNAMFDVEEANQKKKEDEKAKK